MLASSLTHSVAAVGALGVAAQDDALLVSVIYVLFVIVGPFVVKATIGADAYEPPKDKDGKPVKVRAHQLSHGQPLVLCAQRSCRRQSVGLRDGGPPARKRSSSSLHPSLTSTLPHTHSLSLSHKILLLVLFLRSFLPITAWCLQV